MLFSVIIPTFNRKALLFLTLDSVFAQECKDFEVIVVDDGSSDGTLQDLRQRYSTVTVIEQNRQGPGAARNQGALAARGTYLAFLDDDDLWFPWTLKTYAETIHTRGAPAFIAGKPFLFRKEEELNSVGNSSLAVNSFKDYLSSGDAWRWFGVSSFVIAQAAFRSAGGFVNKRMNAEDADVALRLGIAPGFVQITEPYTFAYRQHQGSATANPDWSREGLLHLIESELSGGYPGGLARKAERHRILTRHLRPFALSALRGGDRAVAWKIFRVTLPWHLRAGRLKFIVGFLYNALRS